MKMAIKTQSRWYPQSTEELETLLAQVFLSVPKKLLHKQVQRRIRAMIVPHAGLQYSGSTAAHAFAGLQSSHASTYERVVVIGPSHHLALANQLVVPQATHYQTPLGELTIDRAWIEQVAHSQLVVQSDDPFWSEHSIDNQIPFLQHQFKAHPPKIVPILMGQFDQNSLVGLANFMSSLCDEQTLLVISSDFTHYGESFNYVPFEDQVDTRLLELDFGAIVAIETKNFCRLWDYKVTTGITACGMMPILLAVKMFERVPDVQVQTLKYENSGRLLRDYTHSVSYVAMVFAETIRANCFEYSVSDRSNFLRLARKALCTMLEEDRFVTEAEIAPLITAPMRAHRGAFVTLRLGGQLRGCVGEVTASAPVFQVVIQRAVDAAIHDFRFAQLSRQELDQVEIEISLLSPLRQVSSWMEIRVPEEGVLLTKGRHQALFLPQVAREENWDLPTLLSHLAQKAGLGPHDWRHGAKFEVFTAEVFTESDHGHPDGVAN